MTTTTHSAPAVGNPIARGWAAFRIWRRSRPFWAGFWILLSALELWSIPFLFSLLTRNTLNLSMAGIAGISTMAMTPMMVIMALTVWFAPNYRVFAGVFTIICALLSMLVSNLGGFLLGMILGMIGGGLAFSWAPRMTADQLAAHERAAAAYRAALAGETPVAEFAADGTAADDTMDYADYADADDREAAPATVPAPGGPRKLVGTVAPTLPQDRGTPLADSLTQQRTASDSVSTATSPLAAAQDPDAVPPLPSAQDTPLGA